MVYRAANPRHLEDGGKRLLQKISELEKEKMMLELKTTIKSTSSEADVYSKLKLDTLMIVHVPLY